MMRIAHYTLMAEKIVLLLGDIAHEGVTDTLSAAGISYKWKLLDSGVDNWKSMARIFSQYEVKMVLGKLTGMIYAKFNDLDFKAASSKLLTEIARRPHRLFAYEDLLANKESLEKDEYGDERFWRPSVSVMKSVNNLFREHSVDVLPYKRRSEVTISAQSFINEVEEGLIFRLYVPSGRLWGDQMGRLISLFKDYLSKVAGLNVRLDQQSTSKGVIYAFHGEDVDTDGNYSIELRRHFEDFTKLSDLCATNPLAAEEILKGTGANAREVTQIISRYSKEFRRLHVDLKHAREEKILSIRHRLESELVDVVLPLQQDLIESTVNALIPEIVPFSFGKTAFLPVAKTQALGPPSITVNLRPQFIERVEGIVSQEINGVAQLSSKDKDLILLFEKYGGEKSTELTSALQELNDESAPEPGRVTAKQRVKQFLITLADKIGAVAVDVLQKYVEKKVLGS